MFYFVGGLNTTFSEPFAFSIGEGGILNEYTHEAVEKMYPAVLDSVDLRELEPVDRISLNPMHGNENTNLGRSTNEGITKYSDANENDKVTPAYNDEKRMDHRFSVLTCLSCCYIHRNRKSANLESYSREIKSDKFAIIHGSEKVKNTEIIEDNTYSQVIYVEGIVHQ